MTSPQGPLHLVILLLFISTSATAVKECKLGCDGSPGSIFKHETGTTYKYKLDGTTLTTVSGSPKDVSKFKITASADISALPNCVYSLKLSNVQLVGQDGKKYNNAKELESQPIKFSMNNGRVSSELCTDKDESFNSLNIKRSIISLLQSSANKASSYGTQYETDVFGSCPTNIDVFQSGTDLTVKKSKDLNKCAYREGISVPFSSTGYFTKSEFQATPFLQSANLNVEQKVVSGIVKYVTAQETYEYRPVPAAQSGVKVIVSTKLTLESQAKTAPVAAAGVNSRSIIFEAPHKSNDVSNSKAVLEALKTTCNEIDPVVGKGGAANFAKLVKALSQSKKSDILKVYSDVKNGAGFKNKDLGMELFLDALFHAGSGESVEVMAELIADGKVTGLKAKLWLLSFGMVKHATQASLKAVLPLLKGDDVLTETFLGVGALAGKFCKEHSCVGVPEVSQLEAKLAAPLMAGCKPTSLNAEDHLIASLKGLGNIHYLSPNVVSKLCECASDRSVRNRVRVAALDTIQSDPKKEEFIKTTSNILRNMEEDSEVRIKAYLVLVQSPSGTTAEIIKDVLDKEKVNQVGGFIVSHLRNLRASTNPDKVDAKHHFGAIHTSHKFPFDVRKYSLNHELSYSLDSFNLGASGEANIIYSQQSYVPRSVSLNLTTQLFGHAINLFELDARVENIENTLEKWLGPNGEHTRLESIGKSLEAKIKQLKKRIEQKYENTIRPKRSVTREQLKDLEKKVVLSNDVLDEIADIDVSLKMYGVEVAWFNHHCNEQLPTPESIIDKLFGQLDKAIEEAKNIDVDYKRHSSFLNSDFSYPTSLGLPLKISIFGNSALRMKLDGKLDIPSIIKDPKNAYIRFQIIPSAAVELSSTLVIDGTLVESGVKTKLNINTATGTDLTLRLLNGHGVDVKLGLPVNTQDIITFTSEMVTINTERGQLEVEKKIEFNVAKKGFSVCFDQLEEYIGLTFCGDASVPLDGLKMFLPSNGPSKISLRVEKEDNLSGYHFKVYYKHNKETGISTFDLLLDTPKSKEARTLSLQLEGGINPDMFIKVNAISPWKKINFDGNIANNNKEKIIYAKLVIDGNQEYILKTGTAISGDKDSKQYQPIFEYKAPESSKSGLIGRHEAKKGQAYSVSGLITSAKTDNNNVYYFKDLTFHTPRSKYIVNGNLVKGINLIGTDLKITYDSQSVIVKGKFNNQKENKIESNLQITPSQFPDFGVNLNWNYDHTDKPHRSCSSEFFIVHGSDPESKDSRVTIKNHFWQNLNGNTPVYNDMKTMNSVTYPVLQIEGVLNAAIEPKAASYEMKAAFDKYTISSKLNGKTGQKKPGDYNVDFSANLMENGLQLQAKRDVIEPGKSKFTNSLEITPGRKYQLNAIVVHKIKKGDINLRVDSEIKFPVDKVVKVIAGLKDNKDESSSELKITAEKNLLNAILNLKKTPNPSGNYKIVLPGMLVTNGDFSYDKGNFKGQALLDLVKAKRKMDAKADITIVAPKYAGLIALCWDKSDPKKSVQIKTDSLFNKNEFNTKNTLIFEDYTTQINGNGKLTGSTSSDLSVTCEGEVILPSSRRLSGKYTQSIKGKPDNSELEVYGELSNTESTGKSPTKVNLKVAGKRINLSKLQFDGQVSLGYENSENQNLQLNANLKKVPSGDKKSTINGEVSLGGSLCLTPMSGKLESEVSDRWFTGEIGPEHSIPPVTFHLLGSMGTEFSLDSNGKLSGHTYSGDLTIKTKADSLKKFKWTTNNILDVIPREGAKLKFKTNNVFQHDDNKFVKLNTEINEEENGVNFKFDLESDTISKRSFNGAVHVRPSSGSEPCRGDGSVAVVWGDKTADLTVKVEVGNDKNSGSVHFSGTTPDKKKFDIFVKNKIVPDRLGLHSEAAITVDGKKMTATGRVELIQDHQVIDLVLDQPEGKSKFLLKSDKKGEMHRASEVKLKWTMNGGGSFSLDNEINLHSIDSFLVKINIDSPTLKLDRYSAEITNKEKKIVIIIKSGDKNLISGSSTYDVKSSGASTIVSGSGKIKVKDQEYPLTYTASREPLDQGEKMKLSAEAGKYTLNIDSKTTPTEFFLQRTYCKDVNICKTLKIQSLIKQINLNQYEQELQVLLDLSSLSKSLNDVSFKSHIKRNNWIVDQETEFQWSPNGKIQYKSFIHESTSGITLTMPKRTIAAELNYEMPRSDKSSRLKLEGNLWLDKLRSPNKKTQILLLNNVNLKNAGFEYSNEAKFSHPSLSKDLSIKNKLVVNNVEKANKFVVSGNSIIDIFRDPSQALNTDLEVNLKSDKDGYSGNSVLSLKSVGCKIDLSHEQKLVATKKNVLLVQKASYLNSKGVKREATSKTEITLNKLHLLAKLPDFKLYEILINANLKDGSLTASGTIEILGSVYKESISLDKTPKLDYQFVFSKDGGEKTLDVSAGINKNGEIKVSFDKKNIVQVKTDLSDANFLKTDYSYDYQNAKNLYKNMVSDSKGLTQQAQKLFKPVTEQVKVESESLNENMKNAIPNMSPLFEAYQEQLTAMKNEISSDETLHNVLEDLKESLSGVIEKVVIILEEFNRFYIEAVKIITETLHKLESVVKDSIPEIEKSISTMTKVIVGLMEDLTKFSLTIVDAIRNEIKNHEADIKVVLDSIADYVQEYGKLLRQLVLDSVNEIRTTWEIIVEQIKELPIIDIIKEKWEDLKKEPLSEEILNVLKGTASTIVEMCPTEELSALVEKIVSYIEKVSNKEPVDGVQALKELSSLTVGAVKSIINLVKEMLPEIGETNWKVENLVFWPKIVLPSGALRMSLFAWLQSSDFPSLSEIVETYLSTLNPLDYIPPFRAEGFIIGGSQVITFDGRQISLNGASCSYILAEDYKNNNFSISAEISSGKLVSITVANKNDMIVLRPNNKAVLNGKEEEFPVIQGDLRAWKRANTVGAVSNAGMFVTCDVGIKFCYISISGFYFNRLRGLLGNSNYEPYDDLTLPKGKVTEDVAAFGNAWKLETSCPNIPSTPHTHTRDPKCTEYFTSEKTNLCYYAVNPRVFRDACDHLAERASTPEEKAKAACMVAVGYTYVCREKGVPFIQSPPACVKCTSGDEVMKYGEEKTIKTPGKSADVIFVVHQSKPVDVLYADIVQPLVPALTKALKEKGIGDVKFGMVGYGHKAVAPYSSFFTVNGQLGYDGTTKAMSFNPLTEDLNSLTDFYNTLKFNLVDKSIGTTAGLNAFKDVLSAYPFRSGSVKTIIGVLGVDCPPNHYPIASLNRLITLGMSNINGITYNHIGQQEANLTEGGSVVGYNKNSVFTLTDVKNAMDTLNVEKDSCSEIVKAANGNVFFGENILNMNGADKKAAVEVISKRVAESMTENKQTLKCTCGMVNGVFGKSSCLVKETQPNK